MHSWLRWKKLTVNVLIVEQPGTRAKRSHSSLICGMEIFLDPASFPTLHLSSGFESVKKDRTFAACFTQSISIFEPCKQLLTT